MGDLLYLMILVTCLES